MILVNLYLIWNGGVAWMIAVATIALLMVAVFISILVDLILGYDYPETFNPWTERLEFEPSTQDKYYMFCIWGHP